MHAIPPLTPVSMSEPEIHKSSPLASTSSYGTVRLAKTMKDWIPLSKRSPPLLCLKTTVMPASSESNLQSSSTMMSFANPTILFDYSYIPRNSGESEAPEDLIPRLHYRGRGSLDWSPSYDISCGMLVEQTLTAQRRRLATSLRLFPSFNSECHYLAKDWDALSSKRRRNPAPGIVVLESGVEESPMVSRQDFSGRSQWLSMDFTACRVVIIRPRTRGVEVFDF